MPTERNSSIFIKHIFLLIYIMETSKQKISICWCILAPFLTDEVYKAHEILSKIRYKLIQNIILSVFFLYKNICYITNKALENQKCVINIVKRHRGRSSNYFTFTICGTLWEIRWRLEVSISCWI
jgi:hypothetical protein